MLTQLRELDFRNLHERVDLVEGTLEVFNRESVDSDDPDAGLVADFEDLCMYGSSVRSKNDRGWKKRGGGDFCERFKSHVVAFDSFDMAAAREPSVAVHDEGDMLRDVALAERINKELLHVVDDPFDGRRREEPTAGSGGSVEGRGHCGNRYFSLGGEIETIESKVLGGGGRGGEADVAVDVS